VSKTNRKHFAAPDSKQDRQWSAVQELFESACHAARVIGCPVHIEVAGYVEVEIRRASERTNT
jgi:hypothetical protein